MDDARLLADFVATRSATAFAALVQRHVGLVYAAARRQVGSHHLAEDVTQSVFVLLARKAHTLRGECAIAGWLLKTTRFVAMDAIKLRERRRRHERGAANMHVEAVTNMDPCDAIDDAELAGVLDDGLLALRDGDRRAILMRFYERKTFEDVGRHLGIDADAARKRVGRAVERLRTYFARRKGKIATTAAIIALLGFELHTEAPVHVIARAVRFAPEGASNALADAVSGHLSRINLVRWSIGAAAALCIGLTCANGLKPMIAHASSYAQPTPSVDR